jgi:polysaccharide export outer membrane protein
MKTAAVLLAVVALACATSCYRVMGWFDRGPTYTTRTTEKFESFTPDAYMIGVGDALEITIIAPNERGEPTPARELVRNVKVLPDGTITYLFNQETGSIMVAGKTATEVAVMLQRQLIEKNNVYANATVSALVISSSSSVYYVAGEVRNPGAFNLDQPVTLVQAITRAGWFTEFASRRHIQVIRREGDKEIRFYFNFNDYEKNPYGTKYADFMLRPNDTVLVSD